MPKPWRVVSSTVTHQDRWLRVRSDTCVGADGQTISPYHVLEYPDWITILALTPAHEVILVRQYRHAVRSVLLELPSGVLAAPAEGPAAGAARELEEETGYVAADVFAVTSRHVNPATHTNVAWTVVALGARPTGQLRRDASEDLEIVLLDPVDFATLVASGGQPLQALHTAALWTGLHWLASSPRPDLVPLQRRLLDRGELGVTSHR